MTKTKDNYICIFCDEESTIGAWISASKKKIEDYCSIGGRFFSKYIVDYDDINDFDNARLKVCPRCGKTETKGAVKKMAEEKIKENREPIYCQWRGKKCATVINDGECGMIDDLPDKDPMSCRYKVILDLKDRTYCTFHQMLCSEYALLYKCKPADEGKRKSCPYYGKTELDLLHYQPDEEVEIADIAFKCPSCNKTMPNDEWDDEAAVLRDSGPKYINNLSTDIVNSKDTENHVCPKCGMMNRKSALECVGNELESSSVLECNGDCKSYRRIFGKECPATNTKRCPNYEEKPPIEEDGDEKAPYEEAEIIEIEAKYKTAPDPGESSINGTNDYEFDCDNCMYTYVKFGKEPCKTCQGDSNNPSFKEIPEWLKAIEDHENREETLKMCTNICLKSPDHKIIDFCSVCVDADNFCNKHIADDTDESYHLVWGNIDGKVTIEDFDDLKDMVMWVDMVSRDDKSYVIGAIKGHKLVDAYFKKTTKSKKSGE